MKDKPSVNPFVTGWNPIGENPNIDHSPSLFLPATEIYTRQGIVHSVSFSEYTPPKCHITINLPDGKNFNNYFEKGKDGLMYNVYPDVTTIKYLNQLGAGMDYQGLVSDTPEPHKHLTLGLSDQDDVHIFHFQLPDSPKSINKVLTFVEDNGRDSETAIINTGFRWAITDAPKSST